MPLDVGPSYTDYEAVTVSSSAVGLTAATYTEGGAVMPHALITVETNPIRFRVDGLNPTATEGHLVQPGNKITLDSGDQITKFRAIATGGDATIRVSYGR